MATINLSSEQLVDLSRQLITWKVNINYTGQQIKSTVRSMQGWKDPQFAMFRGAIEMTQGQLEQYCNSLEQLAKTLKMYAEQQKEVNAAFEKNMKLNK